MILLGIAMDQSTYDEEYNSVRLVWRLYYLAKLVRSTYSRRSLRLVMVATCMKATALKAVTKILGSKQ